MSASNGESKNKPSDSEVGYGKPPKDTRFRKGASGNPNGRPKGTLNVATILAATLRERVVINEHGQRKTVTKFEAAIKQLVNKAAGGELRALQQLVSLAKEAEAKDRSQAAEKPATSEIDQEVISGIMKRFQLQQPPQEGQEAEPHDD